MPPEYNINNKETGPYESEIWDNTKFRFVKVQITPIDNVLIGQEESPIQTNYGAPGRGVKGNYLK